MDLSTKSCRLWLGLAAAMATVRIASLWILLYCNWTHSETLASLPLIVLLYPDAYFVPNDFVWTWSSATLFTCVLVLSSTIFVGACFLVSRKLVRSA